MREEVVARGLALRPVPLIMDAQDCERPGNTDQYADRNAAHAADRTTDQYADRGADRGARAEDASGRPSSVRTVDLPELEDRVTESQREAWALGYQAGIADSQTRTGTPTQNPFHPLRAR